MRRAVQVDGMSVRQAAREFWPVAEDHPEDAPVFGAAGVCPQKARGAAETGSWLGTIDQILMDDPSQPKSQRHTAKRIWVILQKFRPPECSHVKFL